MENRVEKAIEQMRQNEEAGLNYIYSKTYNFVYLRAKSILKSEEDVRQLMEDVYLRAYESSEELERESLYGLLGKWTYELGSRSYIKRKEKEAACIEMEKEELNPKQSGVDKTSIGIICGLLEELPDMHQAVLFAFYYDYLKIDEIAQIMKCRPGIVMSRLNAIRQCIKKAMEDYMEAHEGEKAAFSIENVRAALQKWSYDHCLGMTAAQQVYSGICKKSGLKPGGIYLEGKEFAGVNNTIVFYKQGNLDTIQKEIISHEKGYGKDRKKEVYLAVVAILVLAVVLSAVFFAKKPQKEKVQRKNPAVTKQKDKAEPKKEEKPETEPKAEEKQEEAKTDESDYIFPNSQTQALTGEEIRAHTKEEMRLGRNEIYARYGVIFDIEDLDTYFSKKSWYNPSITLENFKATVELSLVEERNINLIKAIEEE